MHTESKWLRKTGFENIIGKGGHSVNTSISPFLSAFQPYEKEFHHFVKN